MQRSVAKICVHLINVKNVQVPLNSSSEHYRRILHPFLYIQDRFSVRQSILEIRWFGNTMEVENFNIMMGVA